MFNSKKDLAIKQMQAKQPLPMGVKEFESWAARIIRGALLEGRADLNSMHFALGSMIVELGPVEAFKEDGYFIQRLRKAIANQIAGAKMQEIRDAAKARLAAEEAAKKVAEGGSNGCLPDKEIQKALS